MEVNGLEIVFDNIHYQGINRLDWMDTVRHSV
ncbi:papain fold toxin domain-containing protein [Anabaena sp. FACHB-709]|uniref:Tox-PL-2 domain-containing protein n=1 Tax=Anabaena cylindrica FACHB-318 TaxID=2692880 RepID=A0ABR7ZRM5_ANACY|nr:hypothetical protein [Anabaena cylindrica FACHB-318]MBD2266430.1 hypothetical protein [Anabaena sp. FACHB-709]MBD2275842.1 hypothetical protein [Nostoc sp. PCC 7120 = FACHB-418]MBD2285633.1 hypothetical protein [Anabaena cylindrica FACHB-170]MBD2351250.1 hypothetical protein [Trichormus variabilis FACHB-171]HBW32981.1 hypothetical protein [Nostoc sp. UBA8866]